MVIPMHMGAMHPFEQVATLVLAVAPFLVLGVVVLVRRRADEREAAQAEADATPDATTAATPDVTTDAAERQRDR